MNNSHAGILTEASKIKEDDVKIKFNVCDEIISVVCCSKITLNEPRCEFKEERPTLVTIAPINKKDHKIENEKTEITEKKKRVLTLHKFTPPNNVLLEDNGSYCVCPSKLPNATSVVEVKDGSGDDNKGGV